MVIPDKIVQSRPEKEFVGPWTREPRDGAGLRHDWTGGTPQQCPLDSGSDLPLPSLPAGCGCMPWFVANTRGGGEGAGEPEPTAIVTCVKRRVGGFNRNSPWFHGSYPRIHVSAVC